MAKKQQALTDHVKLILSKQLIQSGIEELISNLNDLKSNPNNSDLDSLETKICHRLDLFYTNNPHSSTLRHFITAKIMSTISTTNMPIYSPFSPGSYNRAIPNEQKKDTLLERINASINFLKTLLDNLEYEREVSTTEKEIVKPSPTNYIFTGSSVQGVFGNDNSQIQQKNTVNIGASHEELASLLQIFKDNNIPQDLVDEFRNLSVESLGGWFKNATKDLTSAVVSGVLVPAILNYFGIPFLS